MCVYQDSLTSKKHEKQNWRRDGSADCVFYFMQDSGNDSRGYVWSQHYSSWIDIAEEIQTGLYDLNLRSRLQNNIWKL